MNRIKRGRARTKLKELEPLDPDAPTRPVGRPKQFGKNMIFVTIRMPKPLAAKITKLIKKRSLVDSKKIFRSDVIRDAIEHYLKMENEDEE